MPAGRSGVNQLAKSTAHNHMDTRPEIRIQFHWPWERDVLMTKCPAPTKKSPAPKKTLEPPRLKRLGKLADLTAGMAGAMMDGGSGMSRA